VHTAYELSFKTPLKVLLKLHQRGEFFKRIEPRGAEVYEQGAKLFFISL
jgi:hypothetical protein